MTALDPHSIHTQNKLFHFPRFFRTSNKNTLNSKVVPRHRCLSFFEESPFFPLCLWEIEKEKEKEEEEACEIGIIISIYFLSVVRGEGGRGRADRKGFFVGILEEKGIEAD